MLAIGLGVLIAGGVAAIILQPARPEFEYRFDLGVKSWDGNDPFEEGVSLTIGDETIASLPGTWTVSTSDPGPLRPLPAGAVPPVLDGDAFAAFLIESGLDPDGQAEFRPYSFLDVPRESVISRDIVTTTTEGGRERWLLLFLRLQPEDGDPEQETWWATEVHIRCDRPLRVKGITVAGDRQETTSVRDRFLRRERTTFSRELRFLVTGSDDRIEVR